MSNLIREQIEQQEKWILCRSASLAVGSRGREKPEEECPIRTCYQRDRDRILHTMAFRRLKHKTQVFLAPRGDHFTTRLTHTLEVSQIARTIARALRLNEDLTEAIALGHDLGHTPFGHSGETLLNKLYEPGFRHYAQSLRVIDRLERSGRGLNLTFETRNGIERHTDGEQPATPEGKLVRLCDRIAYVAHDIEDAKRAGVLTEDALPKDLCQLLGYKKSDRITTLVVNCIENGQNTADSPNGMQIGLSGEIEEAFLQLHRFMYENVYLTSEAKLQEDKAMKMLSLLWERFCAHPEQMPEEYRSVWLAEGVERAVCDYISGMTDTYAISLFEDLYVPRLYVPPERRTGTEGSR